MIHLASQRLDLRRGVKGGYSKGLAGYMGVEFIPGGDVRLLGTHLEHEDDAGYWFIALTKAMQQLFLSF